MHNGNNGNFGNNWRNCIFICNWNYQGVHIMNNIEIAFTKLLARGTELGAFTEQSQRDLESMLWDYQTSVRNMANVVPYMERLCNSVESAKKTAQARKECLAL
jgi:hypothetical protein